MVQMTTTYRTISEATQDGWVSICAATKRQVGHGAQLTTVDYPCFGYDLFLSTGRTRVQLPTQSIWLTETRDRTGHVGCGLSAIHQSDLDRIVAAWDQAAHAIPDCPSDGSGAAEWAVSHIITAGAVLASLSI
jgi:hypothetical protein